MLGVAARLKTKRTWQRKPVSGNLLAFLSWGMCCAAAELSHEKEVLKDEVNRKRVELDHATQQVPCLSQ